MLRFALAFLVLLAMLLPAGVTKAQGTRSTILGTVVDSSGAVVPNAKVTITNTETNVTYHTTTDASGNYLAPYLNPGRYRVSVEMSGFQKAIAPNAILDIATKLRVNFTLKPGTTKQSVEVRSTMPLLKTDTSSVGTVLTGTMIRTLPIGSRNYQELALLAPTAITPIPNPVTSYFHGVNLGGYYQLGGQKGAYNHYTIDGIDANEMTYQGATILPSLDTIAQFEVKTHDFSAEYGRGENQFIINTRAGTNQVHGVFYDYLQNSAVNASDYFDNRANIPKVPYRENRFGATIGGPIYLPKVYDGRNRTFFFFGYEGVRLGSSGGSTGYFPNPEWLKGNFSTLTNADGTPRIIYDPATLQPNGQGGYTEQAFPGNIIPPDRIDPVAAAAIPYIPTPNAYGIAPGVNTIGNTSTTDDSNYWMTRVDEHFSNRDWMYVRYMQSIENRTTTSLVPLSGVISPNRGHNVVLSEVHTFSPGIINEARIGYNRGLVGELQQGAGGANLVDTVFHLKNLPGTPNTYGLPRFIMQGYSPIGPGVDAPFNPITNTYEFSDNLLMVFGNHTLNAGADFMHQRWYTIQATFARGSFGFNGQFTQLPGDPNSGSPVADFLLGLSNDAASMKGAASANFLANWQFYYLQDDWRATRKLSLNMGIRYEYYQPWSMQNAYSSAFIFGSPPGSCFGASCPPGHELVIPPGQQMYPSSPRNFAPRFGFAYAPFGNRTVFRGAIGVFYSPDNADQTDTRLFNPPQTLRQDLVPQAPTDLTTTKMSNLFPAGGAANPNVTPYTDNWPYPGASFFTFTNNVRQPVVYQWQFDVQHELTPNISLDLGYVGSHGLGGEARANYNQARLDLPGVTTPVASRLPYPQVGIIWTFPHNAKSFYDAGTVSLTKRFSEGLSFMSSFTYSKAIDTYGDWNDFTGGLVANNSYDLAAERSLSSFDARFRYTAGYVWQIPVGRQKRFGSGINPVLNGLIGGWQLDGITTFQSGNPNSIFAYGGGPNDGNPVSWTRPNIVGPVKYLNPRQTGYWFDSSNWSNAPLGTFGNAGRNIVIGPGVNDWDLTLQKNFPIHERATLQFRAEFYNAFNHTQFSGFSGLSPVPGNSGLITSDRGPRYLQFALRLEY